MGRKIAGLWLLLFVMAFVYETSHTASQARAIRLAQQTNNAPEQIQQKLSVEEITTDLNEMVAIFNDLHPNPFWAYSRKQVEKDIAAIIAQARKNKGMPAPDFFRAVSQLVVALDDPHSLAIPAGWTQYRDTGGRLFPLLLRFEKEAAWVDASADARIAPGTRIESINGVSIKALVREFGPLTGPPDDPTTYETMALRLPRYLWCLKGWSDDFHLVIKDSNKERALTVQGVTYKLYQQAMGKVTSQTPLTYRTLRPGVGLIEFTACVEGSKIRALARPIFQRLRAEKITRLIIDARQNGGGGDDAWLTLLEFLTDKGFRGYNGSRFRVSKRLKEMLGEERITQGYGRDAWTAPPGSEIVRQATDDDLYTPDEQESALRFQGKWCVLSGRGTYSSGMSFVCSVKAYKLAPIIGVETGGRVKGFGQILLVQLPKSKVEVYVSTKQFEGAVDVPFRRGVPPDITVAQPADIALNSPRDPVLQAALNYLEADQKEDFNRKQP